MIDLPKILEAMGSGKWQRFTCPVCANKRAGVARGDKGWVLNCWEGCTAEEICGTVGLSVSDLFYDDRDPVQRWDFDWEHEQYIIAYAVSQKKYGTPLSGKDRDRALLAKGRLMACRKWDDTMRKLTG